MSTPKALSAAGILAVSLLAAPPGAGAQTVFRDDFENGTTCYWGSDFPSTLGLPTDPTWASVLQTHADCADFELLGTKDASGLVTAYDEILTHWAWGDDVQTRLDPLGRPVEMVVRPSGVTFRLEWLSATTASLTALHPTGTVQATLLFDMAQGTVSPVSWRIDYPRCEVSSNPWGRTGWPSEGDLLGETPQAVGARSRAAVTGTAAVGSPEVPNVGGTGSVIVTRCGQGVPDSDLFVTVSTNSAVDGTFYNLTCNPIGPGSCAYTVPAMQTPSALLEDICGSLAEYAGNACDWVISPVVDSGFYHQVCMSTALMIDFVLGGPSGEASLILSACEAAFAAGADYCATIGASPAGGAPSIADRICSQIQAIGIAFPETTITFHASATVAGVAGSIQASEAAPINGPYPIFELQVPGDAAVESFTTSPLDPAPGQGYSAIATFACVPAGTLVSVSIAGSDGYTDSITCGITGNGSCTLGVPGADPGVVDTLRASIGGVVQRTTAVSF